MKKPHLTPENLVGQRFLRNVFGNTRIALIGYCPPPDILKRYAQTSTKDQYFIHVAPESVKYFSFGKINFLSLYHVYGGPVSASTVEEMAYYGIEYILAYGLAGGLGTKGLKMGDFYLVESALVKDGTTPHYCQEPTVFANKELVNQIGDLASQSFLQMTRVRAVTADAIYQEDGSFLDSSRDSGCDIINLDSSHLFAASICNNEKRIIKTVECGVISDVVNQNGSDWDSTLSVMLSSQGPKTLNPLELTGKIVEFYIEKLAPRLVSAHL